MGRSSQRTTFWDGFELHPIASNLTVLLTDIGFEFVGQIDNESRGLRWRRIAFDGYFFCISLFPEPDRSPGSTGFSIGLSVDSERQASVERQLGILDCYGSNASYPDSQTVVYIPLPWLMTNWPPRFDGGYQAFFRWRSVLSSEARECALDLFGYLRSHAIPFFELLDTPIKLANILLELETFPGVAESTGGGPLSADPHEYAAVLFHDLGFSERAFSSLERGLSWTYEKVAREELVSAASPIAECKTERYAQWIRSQLAGRVLPS